MNVVKPLRRVGGFIIGGLVLFGTGVALASPRRNRPARLTA
ncbi:MAG TPA: hypothetical protein VGF84_12810 [Micromonosporaceae bacterium]